MPVLPREQPVLLGFAGPEAPGAYAERMVLSEPLLIEVPDDVSTEVAALTEPLAVAYRTVARAELATDEVPLVVGCGPIGLAVIAVLKMKGVGPIVASEFSPERRALAQRVGADVVVDPRETSPYQALMTAAATDDSARTAAPTAVLGQLRLRPTVAFECVGAPGLIQQLIGGVPAGSRIVVAGINTGSDSFEPAQGILKELDIRFSLYYTQEEFAQTFAHLAAGAGCGRAAHRQCGTRRHRRRLRTARQLPVRGEDSHRPVALSDNGQYGSSAPSCGSQDPSPTTGSQYRSPRCASTTTSARQARGDSRSNRSGVARGTRVAGRPLIEFWSCRAPRRLRDPRLNRSPVSFVLTRYRSGSRRWVNDRDVDGRRNPSNSAG